MIDFLNRFESNLVNEITKIFNSPINYTNNLTKTVLIIILSLVINWAVKKLFLPMSTHFTKKQRIKKSINTTTLIIDSILILIIWINALNSFVLITIGLGLFIMVLIRSTLDNIIAWFIISKRNYFKLGDQIEVKGMLGRVVTTSLFYFEVAEIKNWLSSDSLTGRYIRIPNKEIFDEPIANYNGMDRYIWHELTYVLRHDSNWQDAKDIMLTEVNNYYKTILIPDFDDTMYKKLDLDISPVFNLDVSEAGIHLTLRYLVDYSQGAATKTLLQTPILTAFNQHSMIEFAVLDIREIK